MNPFDKIKEQINEDLHHKLPKKWKKIGNILIADFSQINTNNLSQVSQIYANILKVKTVLQKNKVYGELRKPERTEILFGEDTETEIAEYGLKYSMDLSKTMWSPGNTGWRAVLDGPEKVNSFYNFDSPKVIIDYFAGIGYFTIQLAKSYPNAKIISIDKNPLDNVEVWLGKNKTVKVYTKENIYKTIKKGQKKKLKAKVIYEGPIEAPIKKDQKLAKLKIIYDEELIGEYDLLASNNVQKVNIFTRLIKSLNYLIWGDV